MNMGIEVRGSARKNALSKLQEEAADCWTRYTTKENIPMRCPTNTELLKLINISILWYGNPLAIAETFGTNYCVLCSKERHYVAQAQLHNKVNLLNERKDTQIRCPHKSRVHRLRTDKNGADESYKDEKVNTVNDWLDSLAVPRDDIIDSDPLG